MQITLAINANDVRRMAAELHQLSAVHLHKTENLEPGKTRQEREQLKNHLDRVNALLDDLGIDAEASAAGLETVQDDDEVTSHIRHIEDALTHLNQQRRDIEAQVKQTRILEKNIRWLRRAGVAVPKLREPAFLALHFGWMKRNEWRRIEITRHPHPIALIALMEAGGAVLTAAATTSSNSFTLDRLLKSFVFTPLDLPKLASISDDTLQHPEKRLQELENQHRQLSAKKKKLANRWQKRLKSMRGQLTAALNLAAVMESFGKAGGYYVVRAQVDRHAYKEVVDKIKAAASHDYAIWAGNPEKGTH